MKWLTLFFLILSNAKVFAQNKGDNTILVLGKLTYSQIQSKLFDNGFVLTGNDTMFLKTNAKSTGYANMYLILKRSDSTLSFKGYMDMTIDGFNIGSTVVENKGMKGSPIRNSFNEMVKVTESFGLPLVYSK